MLEGGGPRLGHPCLLLQLPPHPQDQEPPSKSDHAETEKPESRRLLLLSLFFVVTSKEEEGKFSSPLVDVWTLFTLPQHPTHPTSAGAVGGADIYRIRGWVLFPPLGDTKKWVTEGLVKIVLETQVDAWTLSSYVFILVIPGQ